MRSTLRTLREWARDYEPAVARTLAAAVVQILVVAGVSLGNLPQIIDAVLTFVGLAATVLAGRSIRKGVFSPASHEAGIVMARVEGYAKGVEDTKATGGRDLS